MPRLSCSTGWGDGVVWLATFAAGFADPDGRAPASDVAGYRSPADPAASAAQVRALAESVDRALRAGAAGRPLRLGESEMPGELALGMILWEYQMHGWDLARATGQPWSPPLAAATASLAFVPAMLTDDYQGEGKPFAPRSTWPPMPAHLIGCWASPAGTRPGPRAEVN